MPMYAITLEFEDSSQSTTHAWGTTQWRAEQFALEQVAPRDTPRRILSVARVNENPPDPYAEKPQVSSRQMNGGY